MPYAKSDDDKKFYTGMNLLKKHWKSIIDNVNSTSQQQLEAANNLMYLCAETPEEKAFRKLALIAFYGYRLGYKVQGVDLSNTEGEDPLDKVVGQMLQNFGGAK